MRNKYKREISALINRDQSDFLIGILALGIVECSKKIKKKIKKRNLLSKKYR